MHGTLRLSCCKTISVMSVSARAALSSEEIAEAAANLASMVSSVRTPATMVVSEAPPVIAVAHTAGNAVCAATPPSATTDGEIPARSRAAVASFLSQLSEEDLRPRHHAHRSSRCDGRRAPTSAHSRGSRATSASTGRCAPALAANFAQHCAAFALPAAVASSGEAREDRRRCRRSRPHGVGPRDSGTHPLAQR